MEGQRVEQKPAGGGNRKKIAIAAGVALGVLACAYVGLCAWVGSSGAIFPHTVVGGVDVSGMTVEQAASALDQAVARHGDQMAAAVTYGDWRGTVTAGQPILMQEDILGYIPFEYHSGEYFALRVRGDSMIGAGILDGDDVIVRRQDTADQKAIVVAMLEDEATVKRLDKSNGHVRLLPENPAYEPIDGDDAQILGLVVAVYRQYQR